MTACDDFLFFDLPEDWELIINIFKEAEIVGKTANSPINPFELEVNLDNSYLALLIQTTKGRPTWRFGGELRQVWDFPKGQQTNSNLGEIQSNRQVLSVNQLEIIKLQKPTLDSFALRYFPPPWFKDVIVIGWKYTGEIENFVKDTLFDIGNQLGVGTGEPPDNSLLIQLQQKIDSLNTTVNSLQNLQTNDFNAVLDAIEALQTDGNLLQQLNQLDAGIFTLFEALKNLIPESEISQLETNLKTRLDLQEEFL